MLPWTRRQAELHGGRLPSISALRPSPNGTHPPGSGWSPTANAPMMITAFAEIAIFNQRLPRGVPVAGSAATLDAGCIRGIADGVAARDAAKHRSQLRLRSRLVMNHRVQNVDRAGALEGPGAR